ncbi:OLC1v1007733C1 [Oldenlandia corymbosa var. corymbosa]|uniref:OLC1v1007733C1 n=1 Tax=Oldenlandia corymbosa var. corymbosa TaxID=529605 RepID=A0AAV1DK03_OLDCO|nr:OLC1v1007733C1 [Oldenlandia corymbosa var. corymbosa]
MGEREQTRREFSVVINNQIAERKGDVNRWSGGDGGIPVYKDYVVMMEEDGQGTTFDILIGLHSFDDLVFGLLNGLEIFKLSDLENNLAAPSPKPCVGRRIFNFLETGN